MAIHRKHTVADICTRTPGRKFTSGISISGACAYTCQQCIPIAETMGQIKLRCCRYVYSSYAQGQGRSCEIRWFCLVERITAD
ncbi:hypothetical protein K503DRAFT_770397, partial [Rhizopogon vinicolor AM-OR11-026]